MLLAFLSVNVYRMEVKRIIIIRVIIFFRIDLQ